MTAEAEYPISSTKQRKIFEGNVYNGKNSNFFVIGVKIYQFKANDSELNTYPLCLENISKDFAFDNMK